MSEMTRCELLAEFCAMAEGVQPNTKESLAAQAFFKLNLVGTTEKIATAAHLELAESITFQAAFLDAVAEVVKYKNGGRELFSAQTYEELIGALPENAVRIKAVLRPLEVQFGVRKPA